MRTLRTVRSTTAVVVVLVVGGCSGSEPQVNTSGSDTVTADTVDDNCDKELAILTRDPLASSLDELVSVSEAVVRVRVSGIEEAAIEQPPEDDAPERIQSRVTVEILEQLAGSVAVDDQLTMDLSSRSGAMAIRDHYLDLLPRGTDAILFFDGEGGDGLPLAIISPGPVVIEQGMAQLGPCGIEEAEERSADTLLAINGMSVAELEERIRSASLAN